MNDDLTNIPKDRRILIHVKRHKGDWDDIFGWYSAKWYQDGGIIGWEVGLPNIEQNGLIHEEYVTSWCELPPSLDIAEENQGSST